MPIPREHFDYSNEVTARIAESVLRFLTKNKDLYSTKEINKKCPFSEETIIKAVEKLKREGALISFFYEGVEYFRKKL